MRGPPWGVQGYVAPWAQGSAGIFFVRGVRGIFLSPLDFPWTPGYGLFLPRAGWGGGDQRCTHTAVGLFFITQWPSTRALVTGVLSKSTPRSNSYLHCFGWRMCMRKGPQMVPNPPTKMAKKWQ